ncbi:MAG TPA: 3-deoxy-7-phosphoheptulonate synthase [Streptosporangiaceae bacterium]|jgi:3-deoxy-7-phosphoheptulonate synthase
MPGTALAPGDSLAPVAAPQQPGWDGHPALEHAKALLRDLPPIVTAAELDHLTKALAKAARAEAAVLQVGDCAESFNECTPAHTAAKLALLDQMAARAGSRMGMPVIQVGRIGGQFAKPRSASVERHEGRELPVFRGHMINSEVATPAARHHDPHRMLRAYEAGKKVSDRVRLRRTDGPAADDGTGPWCSHEMLVIDFEASLLRMDFDSGVTMLGSTHFPWVGERTRQPGGTHVSLLAAVHNPVACKLGPGAGPAEVVELCELLDPERIPGRLTLIVRMGAEAVTEALPPVAAAVREAGHPVIWMCDPMHGNTVRAATGVKTRRMTDLIREAIGFRAVLEKLHLHPGGLHLEVAPAPVTECVGGGVADDASMLPGYTTLCDPRLNPDQAIELIDAWT